MALSAQDQAAVLAAGQQGGLSGAQSQQAVNDANSVTDKSQVFIPSNTKANPTSTNQVVGTGSSQNVLTPAGTTGDSWEYDSAGQRFYKNGDYSSSYGLGQIPSDYGHVIGSTSDYTAGGKIKVINGVPTQTAATATPTNATPATSQSPTATASQTPAAQAPLTMPPSGSVVDLLNSAGQDSSFTARSALASQYGIQSYSGTAAQNTELAQKYITAHDSLKGSAVPQSSAAAQSALQSFKDTSATGQQGDPQANFMDAMGSMNPVIASLYNQVNQLLSAPATTQTFSQEYQKLVQNQGIPALQTQLMNIQNVMNGTQDDIRNEITAAGGFATESQVAALTTARNKTLITQANQLQQQLQIKNDYVNQVMQFSETDQKQVEQQINDKLGLASQLSSMEDKMTSAATDNLNQIVQHAGYGGLAASVVGNPQQQAQDEKLLGLAPGSLSNPKFIKSQDTGKVLGSASSGYFTYDPTTGAVTPISQGKATGGSSSGVSSGSTGAVTSGKLTVSATDIASGKAALRASASQGSEADGKYSDPTLYLNMYKHWRDQGGTAKDFLKQYPYATYINPANTWLAQSMTDYENQASGASSGSLF